MQRVQITPGRRFLIHGVLVLLPLVLLTAMAVSWLRQERLVVWESAKEVARLSSNEGARRIGERIRLLAEQWSSNALAEAVCFKVSEDGRLLIPRPRDLFPQPKPYLVKDLSGLEKSLWLQALATDSEEDVTVRTNAWNTFLKVASATNGWRSLAQYHLALALKDVNPTEASRLLKEVFTVSIEARLESGLPLLPMAEWQWMELNSNQVTSAVMSHFCSNAVSHPSLLTRFFLVNAISRAGKPAQHWMDQFEHDETARRLFVAGEELWAVRGKVTNVVRLHWIEQDDSSWLAIYSPARGEVVALRFEDVAKLTKEELRINRAELTRLDYEVKVAGKTLISPFYLGDASKIDQVSETIIAAVTAGSETATVVSADRAVEVRGFLQQTGVYQSQQNLRLFLFGSVIFLAVIVALTGLVSAWRTFQQQWQLSEMKSNFVSSVSHELRAPLASVRLMAESLERGKVKEPERQHEYFQLIGRECRRLTALIENVLDFARMDQGRKLYQMEPTDLVTLMRHTVKGMEAYAAERDVMLDLKITGKAHDVMMDGQAIQQALVNLIDNAVKYSPKKGLVRVSLEFVPGHVLISVQDEGPGIPVEERERIFERFYRRGRELRRETQGVGIGLSIVKHVVEAHGGCVGAQDAEGLGSIFAIIIPTERLETKPGVETKQHGEQTR